MCSCVASDTLIDEATDANLFLSPCPRPCPSACSCLPAESPGTEQLGFTSGRWNSECHGKTDEALKALSANWSCLVGTSLAVVRLSSMAGLGRVGDQEITASCQQLRSVHMLSSECPCQLEPWHIQAKVLLEEVFSWANNVWKGVRSLFFYELLRLLT